MLTRPACGHVGKRKVEGPESGAVMLFPYIGNAMELYDQARKTLH